MSSLLSLYLDKDDSRTKIQKDADIGELISKQGIESDGISSASFCCILCDLPCSSIPDAIEHIRSHNKESPWTCHACEQIDLSGETRLQHNQKCWENEDAANDNGDADPDFTDPQDSSVGHKCTLCPYRSSRLFQVLDHIRLHMRKRENKLSELFESDQQKEQDNIYTCTECEFSCVRPDKLEKHMELHAKDTVFRCKKCSMMFDNIKNLRSHIRTHGFDRPFACPLCPARFTRNDNMKLHVKIHSGFRQHLCKLCPYAATNKSGLIHHYRAHSQGTVKNDGGNRSSVECPVCSRSYASYQYLIFHLKTHQLLDPFKCEMCEIIFESSETLMAHYIEHIDQIAMACAYCRFKCFDDATIHNHLGNAHSNKKPFQCEVCGYRFSNMTHWKRHQLVHTGEKPFSCDICGARFCASQNRKAHMIKLHQTFIPLPKKGGRYVKMDKDEG